MAKLKTQADGRCRAYYKGKRFSGRTSEEALAKRDAYKYEVEHGIDRPEMITVIDLAEQWMPIAHPAVDSRTYNQYVVTMEKMTDLLGNKLVAAVTPADIKKVWMRFNGLSQSYINKAKFLYKSFFRYAIDNGYCRTNPVIAASAKPHKGTKGTHRCLSAEEIQLIETVPHRVQPAAMFMLKAGLRRGEVLALKRSDIYDNRIHVHSSLKFIDNHPVVGRTKNESSEREVPLFAPLKPFFDSMGEYVMTDAKGNLCSETAFQRAWEGYLTDLSTHLNGEHKRWYHLTKEWKEAHPDEYAEYLELKKNGNLEQAEAYRLRGWVDVDFRPHDLRHTFATTGRNKNIDIHTMMDWLGHSSERMLLQIYDHTSEEREKKAIALMDS